MLAPACITAVAYRLAIAALQEFSIARASFMLTHRVDAANFDFMALMHESLDLDFSKVGRMAMCLPRACNHFRSPLAGS